MNARLVQVTLGDWSDAGSENAEATLLRLAGSDSTDDAMRKALKTAEQATGINLQNTFADGRLELTSKQLATLVSYGFDPKWPDSDMGMSTTPFFIEGNLEPVGYSVISLLMFFAGFQSEDFYWEIIRYPSLTGSHNSILGIEIGISPLG